MHLNVPLLPHLESIGKLVVGHAWLPPGGFPEFHPALFGRLVFFIPFLLGFHVKV